MALGGTDQMVFRHDGYVYRSTYNMLVKLTKHPLHSAIGRVGVWLRYVAISDPDLPLRCVKR
jgi:hypothetical protein